MPKGRERDYHAQRATGGVAPTMIPGAASTARGGPPVFNPMFAWNHAVVPFVHKRTGAASGHGAVIPIQRPHLDRRTY